MTVTEKNEQLMGNLAGASYGASALSRVFSPNIDYGVLKGQASQKKVQADQLQLNAIEIANDIRESFNESVGNFLFSASQRGVSVQGGGVQQTIERSAGKMGKDVAKLKKQTDLKAGALRSEAKILSEKAGEKDFSQIFGAFQDIMMMNKVMGGT